MPPIVAQGQDFIVAAIKDAKSPIQLIANFAGLLSTFINATELFGWSPGRRKQALNLIFEATLKLTKLQDVVPDDAGAVQ